MGTMRLAVAFGAGLIGILYLALALTPLATGALEFRPTSLSIDTVESEGFPEPWYLEVADGYIVFSEAHVRLENEDGEKRELVRLTAPVVSESLLGDWQASVEQGERLDASYFRLLASFEAEQVTRLWPEIVELVANGQPLDVPPVKMVLTGDTEPAQYMIYKPYEFKERTRDFDWEQVRWLRFERHFQSPGRFVKNFAIGIGLLFLALAAFRYHRSRPDDVSRNVIDWSAIPEGSEDAADIGDIDLDV